MARAWRTLSPLIILGMAFALWVMHRRIADLEARAAPRTRVIAHAPSRTAHPAPPSGLLARIDGLEAQVRALAARRAPAEPPDDPTGAPRAPAAREVRAGMEVLDEDVLRALLADFTLFDADRDGGLSAEEVAVTPEALAVFDLDRDRRLTPDEVERLTALARNARRAASQLDRGDGAFPISFDDFSGGRRRFHFLDRDGDGQITEAEFVASLADAVREVRRFDLDQDGALTAAELWDAPTRLQRFDLDGDGVLYAWEVSQMMARAKW